MDPSSLVGWAEVNVYYDEFRVVGGKLQLYSVAPNSITRICDLITVVYDNDDTSTLTTTTQAYSYADKMIFPSVFLNSRDGFVFSAVRPTNKTSPIPWVDVGNPSASPGAFKFFSETLDTSVNILRLYWELYLEVRGRR